MKKYFTLLLACLISFGLPAMAHGRERYLGIDVNESSSKSYVQAFEEAQAAGLNTIVLNLEWNEIERQPGVYDTSILAIANYFYPRFHTPLALTISPVNTNQLLLPNDLRGRSLDDPVVIARFVAMVAFVLDHLPDVELSDVVLGNEFDVYLQQNSAAWTGFIKLYRAFTDEVRKARPGVPVGAEATFEGLTEARAPFLQVVNRQSDVVAVSYYPLGSAGVRPPTTVHADFARLADAYPGKPIHFLQLGYPSSLRLGSSRTKQAQFVTETFVAWDAHADQVQLINFSWMHDLTRKAAAYWRVFYGTEDARFAAFLRSLGLRTRQAKAKPAFTRLVAAAAARGFPNAP